MEFLFVCLGGAVGTGARFLLSDWALRTFGNLLPFGTLAVNIVGSFFITLVMYVGIYTNAIAPSVRVVLTVGFLGGFTTYSSFNYETLGFFQNGEIAKGLLYAAGMMLLCLAAGAAGIFAGKLFI